MPHGGFCHSLVSFRRSPLDGPFNAWLSNWCFDFFCGVGKCWVPLVSHFDLFFKPENIEVGRVQNDLV